MTAEKKLAAVASVLTIGLAAALFFRKDAAPITTSAQIHDGLVFSEPLERRLPSPPAGLPALARLDSAPIYRVPTAAAGISSDVATELPPNHQGYSPVGALLKPLEYVDADGAETRPAGILAEAPATVHKIVDGDTLSGLAAGYLGSADRYLELYEHNRDVLSSPDLLPIGKTLRIPAGKQTSEPDVPVPLRQPEAAAPLARPLSVVAP